MSTANRHSNALMEKVATVHREGTGPGSPDINVHIGHIFVSFSSEDSCCTLVSAELFFRGRSSFDVVFVPH